MASAGVLYVWFFRELSIAVGRSKNSGMCRPEAWIALGALQRGRGEDAIHRPPSEAKDFCGAK